MTEELTQKKLTFPEHFYYQASECREQSRAKRDLYMTERAQGEETLTHINFLGVRLISKFI